MFKEYLKQIRELKDGESIKFTLCESDVFSLITLINRYYVGITLTIEEVEPEEIIGLYQNVVTVKKEV